MPPLQETVARIAARSPSSGRWQLAAWGALAWIWFGSLGWRALISPDEGRYATIALGMMQSGDWLTPRLNGLLYFEKPPLPYWAGAASLQLLGINEFAVRLWPALTGFLTVIVVAATARRLWGEAAGRYAALVAGSTTWIIAGSHFLSLDMGLAFFLTLALCGFLLAQRDGIAAVQRRHLMWLCWAAMAGATLTKGLVGLVIPGATLMVYSLVQRQFDFWRRMHWASGLAIYLALAAPWFAAMSIRHPEFFDFFFVHEHFRRFLTDEARRTGSLLYFVPYLLAGLLPWTTLLPGLCRTGAGGEPGANFQPLRLLLIWSAFVFVFFSISRSKLPSYILPMFPALALLAGHQLARMAPARLRWHLLAPAALAFALLAALPFAGRLATPGLPMEVVQPFARALALAAATFLLAAALAWRLLARGQQQPAVALVALGSLLALTLGMAGHDSYGAALKSSKTAVAQLAPYLRPDTEVFAVRTYDQTLPFYLRRPVTLVDYRDEFSLGERADPARWLPSLDPFVARWRNAPRAAALMAPETYRELQQLQLPMRVAYRDPNRVVVVKPEADSP